MSDAYCYAMLRYSPNPSLGEYVNVGVLLAAQDGSYAGLKVETDCSMPRSLSAGFDESDFEHLVAALDYALKSDARPRDFVALKAWLIPDTELAYCFGNIGAGVKPQSYATMDDLLNWFFERNIRAQRPPESERRKRDQRIFEETWLQTGAAAVGRGMPPTLESVLAVVDKEN